MISIVIPVHNEEEVLRPAVERLVADFSSLTGDFEILLVENGSTDGTWAALEALAAAEPRVRPLRSPRPDYGVALKLGLLEARGEFILSDEIDVLSHDFHRASLRLLADGIDLVIASKRHSEARDDRGLFRRLGSNVITLLLKLACGLNASDTHGLKAWRRAAARALATRATLGGDLFASECVLLAERAGLAIRELPLSLAEIRPTPISLIRRVPKVLKDIMRLRRALAGSRSSGT